jgi:hypothetical protein
MPIQRVVTGGALLLFAGEAPSLVIETTDCAVRFALADTGGFLLPNTVAAGTSYDASGILAGDQTLHNGVIDVGGAVHPTVWFTGTLTFTATPVLVPPNSAVSVHLDTAFTFAGDLQGYDANPFVGPPGPAVFDYQLKGKGRVTVRLSASRRRGGRSATSVFFAFR